MTPALTYQGAAAARNGELTPLFSTGKSMYSLYNPARDAEVFAAQEGISGAGFIVIFGLGSGIHVAAVRQKNPAARILVVEHSDANIQFLRTHFDFSILDKDDGIIFYALDNSDNLFSAIINNYIPVLHGSFIALFQQAWKQHHAAECLVAEEITRRALDAVKADYATQAHFGKIWHGNIFKNMQTFERLLQENSAPTIFNAAFPLHKKACIVAAGPSLDVSFSHLVQNRAELFIIAADTAYLCLLRRGIIPDAVLTIDGQHASVRHFMHGISPCTTLIADLCCNPSIPRAFAACNAPVIFTRNGHPLSELAHRYLLEKRRRQTPDDMLPYIASGAGTVTISALDFAVQAGFKNICLFGADFSFPFGKPYAKGSYFDDQFYNGASRIHPAETNFSSLLFRGKTILVTRSNFQKKVPATPLLETYRESLEAQIRSYQDVNIASHSICEITRG